jgi:hypothetical protein
MRVDGKSMLLGAVATMTVLVAAGVLLMRLPWGGPQEAHHRTLKLSSGRTLEVTALYLGFGDEHSGRGAVDDAIGVEYVTSAPQGAARDKEEAEVFEAIRPISESLGVGTASVSAFPSLVRKGHYERYDYTRSAAGAWTSQRVETKVFAND